MLTPEKIDHIRHLRRTARGWTKGDIARHVGVTRDEVDYVLANAERTGNEKPASYLPSPEEIAEQCRKIKSGELVVPSKKR